MLWMSPVIPVLCIMQMIDPPWDFINVIRQTVPLRVSQTAIPSSSSTTDPTVCGRSPLSLVFPTNPWKWMYRRTLYVVLVARNTRILTRCRSTSPPCPAIAQTSPSTLPSHLRR